MATHITYDVDAFFGNNIKHVTAKDVLRTRSAVCSGYAGMFDELCKLVGLDCRQVNGYGKGFGYKPELGKECGYQPQSNHAWNAVRLHTGEDAGAGRGAGGGDQWFMLDACWGAGHVCTRKFNFNFNPFYFLTDPTEFIYDHMPTTAAEQFLPPHTPPVTWREFFDLPKLEPRFWNLGVQIATPLGACGVMDASVGDEVEFCITLPKQVKFFYRVQLSAGDAYEEADVKHFLAKKLLAAEPSRTEAKLYVRPKRQGRYKVVLYARIATDDQTSNGWPSALTVIINVSPSTHNPATGDAAADADRDFVSKSGGYEFISLVRPRLVPLRAGEREVFELIQMVDPTQVGASQTKGTLQVKSPSNRMYPMYKVSGDVKRGGEVYWRADVGLNERGDWHLIDMCHVGGGGRSWQTIATYPVA